MASLDRSERISRINALLAQYPDFPKPGITFLDIFPLMRDAVVFEDLLSILTEHIKESCPQVEVIVGLEARGFIFGPLLAQRLGISFVPVRKAGKLPGKTIQASYSLEYGKDKFEAQADSIKPGQKIIIVDDLLATGGTLNAACTLMKQTQADIVECIVVIELLKCEGRKNVPAKVFSLIESDV